MESSSPPASSSILIGVDEAGRGPLLGDMVVSAVAFPGVFEEELAVAGVRDSKRLTPEARRALYNYLLGTSITVVLAYVPPWVLNRENLNDVEVKYISRVVKTLSKILHKARPHSVHVVVDEVRGREEAIKRAVYSAFPYVERVEAVVEAHADSKYVAVGAASIVAKVARDIALKPIKRLVGDFGSGYASDPRTREWVVKAHANTPEPPLFVRRTWATLKDIAPRWYTRKRGVGGRARSLLDYAKR